MAKVRKNVVISGLSGSLGDQLVIQTGKGGQTIIRTKPRPSDQPPSAAQAEARQLPGGQRLRPAGEGSAGLRREGRRDAQKTPYNPSTGSGQAWPSPTGSTRPKWWRLTWAAGRAAWAGGHPYLSTCFKKPGRTLGFADPKGFRQI